MNEEVRGKKYSIFDMVSYVLLLFILINLAIMTKEVYAYIFAIVSGICGIVSFTSLFVKKLKDKNQLFFTLSILLCVIFVMIVGFKLKF